MTLGELNRFRREVDDVRALRRFMATLEYTPPCTQEAVEALLKADEVDIAQRASQQLTIGEYVALMGY